MSKLDKKRNKLKERIEFLESELRDSLGRKSSAVEINVSAQTRKIQELRKELSELK